MYFLLDLVDELDLSEILILAQDKDPRGEKGFDARMMTMLLRYAYCVGTVSARNIEQACYEVLVFRVLIGNQQPYHSRISDFRLRNLDALKGLFVQILRLCQKAGMVSLGHVALDGTKLKANASKHKAMSHERMLRAEKQLAQEINALMRKAEILDAQEDRLYGKNKLGSDLPDELRRRQDRLEQIRQARKEMEAETAAAAGHQRQEEADAARAEADAAQQAEASAAEQKEDRGLRRFLLRGLEKVDAEWHLIATMHNLLKLFRHRRSSSRCWHWPPDEDPWLWRRPELSQPPPGSAEAGK